MNINFKEMSVFVAVIKRQQQLSGAVVSNIILLNVCSNIKG